MEPSDTTHALRLTNGHDLKEEIIKYVTNNQVEAGWIITCAGSLTEYNIRFANQKAGSKAKGFFEILSLTGTLSINGCHIHICISDSNGATVGGHLLNGCKIYTTAEIILSQTAKYIFTREMDDTTGFRELNISKKIEDQY